MFYLFPIQKHTGPNLTSPWNRSRSTQGHHLNKLGSTRAPNAAYQVSRSLTFWFQRRRFFKVFTIYGHGGHLSHVTWTVWTNFCSLVLRRLRMKFGFNRPSDFRGEDVWKCWHTYNTYTHTYRWQRPTYHISSPLNLWLRWAKKYIFKSYGCSACRLMVLVWNTPRDVTQKIHIQEAMVLTLCMSSFVPNTYVWSFMNISWTVEKLYRVDTILSRNCYIKSSKGCNSKSVNIRVMVLMLCMSASVG